MTRVLAPGLTGHAAPAARGGLAVVVTPHTDNQTQAQVFYMYSDNAYLEA